MDRDIQKQLTWIDEEQPHMVDRLASWAAINSGSGNLTGLNTMLYVIKNELDQLNCLVKVVDLNPRTEIDDFGKPTTIPHGQALHAVIRPEAPLRIFLGGHMDTVFSTSHPFQKVTIVPEENQMIGPGVADMKGGLIVMLTALKAFEMWPDAKNVGWEVVINPDEEVGSNGSLPLLLGCAARCHYALLFEPSFHDGAIVDARKGSCNLIVIARGKSAHAGRDFDKGINAIAGLARFIVDAEKLNNPTKGITINFGKILGGGPINIVPEIAVCHVNARAVEQHDFDQLTADLGALAKEHSKYAPIELHNLSTRQPKNFDAKSQKLFGVLKQCADEEGISLQHRPSGGVCDGNIFAAEGLPVIDTLGVIGGGLHTPEEYMQLDSLASRTRLTFRLLTHLAHSVHKGNQ